MNKHIGISNNNLIYEIKFIILVLESKRDTIDKNTYKKNIETIQASGFWILQ